MYGTTWDLIFCLLWQIFRLTKEWPALYGYKRVADVGHLLQTAVIQMQIIKAKFQFVKAPFNRVNDAVSGNRMSANQPYNTLAISVYIKKSGVLGFTCMLPQSEN